MIKHMVLVLISLVFTSAINLFSQNVYVEQYGKTVNKIIKATSKDSSAWERLAYMCDTFGSRLSGSKNLENTIEWALKEMKKDGFANVHREKVIVPHWVRGKESCELIEPRYQKLSVTGIGGTIGTPAEGITAPLLVVSSFEELEQKKNEAKGKIVLFDVPFTGYGKTVQYRFYGAFKAIKAGAVASLIRSVSPIGFAMGHTGMMKQYPTNTRKIPHAAISMEDAMMLHRIFDRGQNPVVKLYLDDKTLPDTVSYNVVGELRGSEKPDEIIAVGGHIDSWDVGSGAQDDGSGIISTWEAVKLLMDLGIKPKRTIRVVLWTNEENGARGGKAYAKAHKDELHSLVFEFDSGVFPPKRISYSGPDSILAKVKQFEPLLQRVGNIEVRKGGGGVDIGPMMRENKVNGMGLGTDDGGRYFWYHHSPSDTPDKVDPKDMNDCIATIAIAIYLYSELP
jgi:carboxypeptidase Q